jgi:hypothetical protein
MSADPTGAAGQHGGTAAQPSEEELRAAYEAELNRITSTDMIAQAVVSLLNIGARRLAPEGAPGSAEPGGAGTGPQGRAGSAPDLDQVRDAIDAVRALLDILERSIPAQELRSLRDALSQLQMAYAREVQAAGGQAQPSAAAAGAGEQPPPGSAPDAPAGEEGSGAPGPAESSGRLWVPGR